MVVFLAADVKRMEELSEAVRDYLAWQDIAGRVEGAQPGRTASHSGQEPASGRRPDRWAAHSRGLSLGARAGAATAGPPGYLGCGAKADGAKEHLAERASDKLCQSDLLRIVQGARSVRYDLDQRLSSVWERGHVRVGELWGYYCHYPYLPRLRDRSVLDDGITRVFDELTWDIEGFAVATGYDEQTGRYVGLAIPHQDPFGQVTDGTLLVHADLALAQRQQELAERAAAAGGPEAAWSVKGEPGSASDEIGSGVLPGPVGSVSSGSWPRPRTYAGAEEHALLRRRQRQPRALRP